MGRGCRAQLEDLLIALADRRSFPETLFFVARGIVGETWSTESVVAPVVFPASVLALLVKEPSPFTVFRPLRYFLICPTHWITRRGREDLRGKVLKGHDLSVVLNDGLQVECPLLIEALVESQP